MFIIPSVFVSFVFGGLLWLGKVFPFSEMSRERNRKVIEPSQLCLSYISTVTLLLSPGVFSRSSTSRPTGLPNDPRDVK